MGAYLQRGPKRGVIGVCLENGTMNFDPDTEFINSLSRFFLFSLSSFLTFKSVNNQYRHVSAGNVCVCVCVCVVCVCVCVCVCVLERERDGLGEGRLPHTHLSSELHQITPLSLTRTHTHIH